MSRQSSRTTSTKLVSYYRVCGVALQANGLLDINPKASDDQVLRAGHWCVAIFAAFMAAFATMLHGVKIDLGFIYVSSFLNQ